ncbi:AI-2E family transporter [Texcoconibacillus texcoconensis]|uniref:Putative PurR-regulated permease PerM n=1 Tax=Texcoconibacillus texcoconensis TaxID=1095777 RepID=A0A840QST8_9BACI|nr:AI-2E family transporter [Texcoconibacillus texcoconensis]MBB5174337.1 putative PurR-regulated permease PerM [Texcoconibacillus texcoconensis]
MPQTKFFRFLYATAIILLIIYLSTKVPFIFTPVTVAFQTLFIPIIIAGVLFYLLRPFVNLLHKRVKIPRTLAILMMLSVLVGLLALVVWLVGPTLQVQINNLINNLPSLVNEVRHLFIEVQQTEWFNRFQETEDFSIEEITENLADYVGMAIDIITSNIANFIGFAANTVLIFIMIPFILFYMLKDGEKLPDQTLRLFPEDQTVEGKRILRDMDGALSSYIQGQIIVSFCVGVMMFIAFSIIGIDYSLVLALIGMFTNLIPFIGPWIGAVPAAIVGIIDSPFMLLKVIISIVIIQQIESNLIAPQVMGHKLRVHPLTILLLLIVAGRFGGFLTMLLAVPTYAITKVIVSHTYRLVKLKKQADEEKKRKAEKQEVKE